VNRAYHLDCGERFGVVISARRVRRTNRAMRDTHALPSFEVTCEYSNTSRMLRDIERHSEIRARRT
jgi:hypothetical protein